MTRKLELLKAHAKLEARENPKLFNTVIKEGLHRDILICLAKSDVGKGVVFQGGTALRLCYKNNRYSEDLDFVSPEPVNVEAIERFKLLLTELVKNDYGADVEFKNPKESVGPTNASGIDVKRWSVKIELGSMEGTTKSKQQIHVEIAEGIPALDARPTAINRFTASPVGSPPVIMQVSSMDEILADKIVAIVGRKYLKARDIWDVKFLHDSGVKLKPEWVLEKCKHYGISDSNTEIAELLKMKASELARPETADTFKNEMSRFLGRKEADAWINQEFGTESILMEVGDTLERIATLLERPTKEILSTKAFMEKINNWRKRHDNALDEDQDSDQGNNHGPSN